MARNNRDRSESSATILGQQPAMVMQGYLLKKKRKRMQGLARRWFTLSASVRRIPALAQINAN